MAKPQAIFKLQVRFGEAEFSAEGTPDLVTARFDEFRRLLAGGTQGVQEQKRAAINRAQPEGEQAAHEAWKKLVHDDPGNRRLTLRVIPQGKERKADAALLLLLAHRRIRGEETLAVTRLIAALKQSGCPVSRLDRVLDDSVQEHLVLKSGRGKGGHYRLTNQGVLRAEAIAEELRRMMTPHASIN